MKQREESTELENETDQSVSGIKPGELIIGTLVGIDEQGNPLVDFSENPQSEPLSAITTVSVSQYQVGRQVALLFANGDPLTPIVVGLIHSQLHELIANYQEGDEVEDKDVEISPKSDSGEKSDLEDVFVDGKRLVIEGKEEVVIKCGESSITLTKSGKILIRGKYLLNRSSGVNRIMGGSVQVN